VAKIDSRDEWNQEGRGEEVGMKELTSAPSSNAPNEPPDYATAHCCPRLSRSFRTQAAAPTPSSSSVRSSARGNLHVSPKFCHASRTASQHGRYASRACALRIECGRQKMPYAVAYATSKEGQVGADKRDIHEQTGTCFVPLLSRHGVNRVR
jgi:hypothetical protein